MDYLNNYRQYKRGGFGALRPRSRRRVPSADASGPHCVPTPARRDNVIVVLEPADGAEKPRQASTRPNREVC